MSAPLQGKLDSNDSTTFHTGPIHMFPSLISCLYLAQAGIVHIPTVWQMEMNESLVTSVKSSLSVLT